MKEKLSQRDFQNLAEVRRPGCVSIFMTVQTESGDFKKEEIQFKNLLNTAEERLPEEIEGVRRPKEILTPARELKEDLYFWQYPNPGLALFMAPGIFFCCRLPVRFDVWTVCSQRFHLKPLMAYFNGTRRFYVLALSINAVRLIECNSYDAAEVDLGDVAGGLGRALDYDSKQRQLQFHTGAQNAGGGRAGIFHGQGVGKDDRKDEIQRFFRQVDENLNKAADAEAPLVLAGVDYLLPLFQAVTTRSNVLEQGIAGNLERCKPLEIQQMALKPIEMFFQREESRVLEQVESLLGTGLASTDLRTVVGGACYGRVESLFVSNETACWGSFDADRNLLETKESSVPGVEDLTDRAAVETYVRGGNVYPAAESDMPTNSSLAAVFRY